MENEVKHSNFIHDIIDVDLQNNPELKIHTRFPPEPNGYLHIGSVKAICINTDVANKYNGLFNLRYDDTNPVKEDDEFVKAIEADLHWLRADPTGGIYYGSDYFDKCYEFACKLIKDGKAFVCDLSQEEMAQYRGTLTEPGKESPYRNRSVEENLDLFERMKNGEFKDGERVLRAKIDMASANINMRDPIIYRVAHMHHHNTGDKWCIYPMYDFAHPIEDAIEKITHSICTLEFEDHRPLYDWVVRECEFDPAPRQIEFAKLYLTNVVTGKRYIKKLVEQGIVDGWDDPRLGTLRAIARRGINPKTIYDLIIEIGVKMADSAISWKKIYGLNRNLLEPIANRYFFVEDPQLIEVKDYADLTIKNGAGEVIGKLDFQILLNGSCINTNLNCRNNINLFIFTALCSSRL